MTFEIILNGKTHRIEKREGKYCINNEFIITKNDVKEGLSKREIQINHQGKNYSVQVLKIIPQENIIRIKINNKRAELKIKDVRAQILEQIGLASSAEHKAGDVRAPMPGKILEIRIQKGQQVKAGDDLLILEAMKMENLIKAPADGTVDNILVQVHDTVEKNALLVKFK